MPSSERLLLSAFAPFAGRSENASIEAVCLLKAQLNPRLVAVRILPVEMNTSANTLISAIDELRPRYVICVGEARRGEICMERVGANSRQYTIPDNAGNKPPDGPVVPSAPSTYSVSLPLVPMMEAMQSTGVPVRFSDDAGRFLCNEVLYCMLHQITTRRLHISAGFIHVPLLPGAEPETDSIAGMRAEDTARAILAGISVLSAGFVV